MAMRDDGTLYYALTVRLGRGSNMGVVALRDTDGDGAADVMQRFATEIPGTALQFHDGYLYFGSKTAVYRFAFEGDELVPSAPPEVVVDGFPEQRLHEAKTFAIDDDNNLYVNVGAPSNACMVEFRTRGLARSAALPATGVAGRHLAVRCECDRSVPGDARAALCHGHSQCHGDGLEPGTSAVVLPQPRS